MRNPFRKSWLTLVVLAGLVTQSQAQIGSTLDLCRQRYGKPVSGPVKNIDPGVDQYHFKSAKLELYVRISADTRVVTAVYYSRLDRGRFSDGEIMQLLQENGKDISWVPVGGEQAQSADQKNWMGIRNGNTVMSASYQLMEEGEGYVLNIRAGT
ncbi:MAG: hypothetical protein JOZ08_26520 [Verrucomicrobia bacterium]|nr:hypothetical protein [Verrucomicrobiota bacterium]